MLTVYSQVKAYCDENNLPMARRVELKEIGKFIGTHFRRFWGLQQPATVIQEAGFVLSDEPGKPQLVIAYPVTFKEEIKARIALFYDRKKQQIAEQVEKNQIQPEKVTNSVTDKQRKRIPVRPELRKIASAKPSENTTP